MEKDLLIRTLSVCTLMTSAVLAEVIVDQIGPMNGSWIGESSSANQYFEATWSTYDIAVLENLNIVKQTELVTVEFVLTGWDGFTDPSSITAYEANVYSDTENASLSLVGDYATQVVDIADVSVPSEWYGLGFLISVPVQLQLEIGTYWYALIPSNHLGDFGQVAVQESLFGDGILSMQANPGEGFGFGPIRELSIESAFRVSDNTIVDPCASEPLPSCPEDITNDGFVSILDVLSIIAQWGDCGDGTYRPAADCAPLPNGDCCVNISDILAVVAAWDAECQPHGACCLPEGSCDSIVTEQYCLINDGVYFGDNSICEEHDCFSGACCVDSSTCVATSQFECSNLLGIFKGDETLCATVDCTQLAPGDECSDSLSAFLGTNLFDTRIMSPSEPVPDEAMCTGTSLNWVNSPDVWFSFDAPLEGRYSFSLCDIASYDTSMVLYENCSEQIACNGDAANPDGNECQDFYSHITIDLNENESCFVRIGGYEGAVGMGTLTIELLPPPQPGACCFATGACFFVLEDDCTVFGGVFEGEEILCEQAECVIVVGDECDESTEAFIGSLYFTTVYATPSTPLPSESQCPGTYLEWGSNNPDVWMHWVATDDGIATFTTCDNTSFDTSMVLYETFCINQVACNGDAPDDDNCQNYHSVIEYPVTNGTVYYIRVGGWQGSSGEGTLTISLVGENDIAACCSMGACIENQTELECISIGGNWQTGETCKTFNCAEIPCHSSIFAQPPHSPSDDWEAGNSSIDSAQSTPYNRAEYVNVAATNTIKVWGLQAYLNGSWSQCDADYNFAVHTYVNVNGFPGQMVTESLHIPAKKRATGTLYMGIYELKEWDIPYQDVNVDHISVQSQSDGLDCWFLWMSSGTGNGYSSVNSGNGWLIEDFDLSICVE